VYDTDVTDSEWTLVRAAMPVPAWMESRGGRPQEYCHREMVDAARHLVDSGGKWRALPVDYPGWRAVYEFFRRWEPERIRAGAVSEAAAPGPPT
jgi:transposase